MYLVEVAGIEPASKDMSITESTCVVVLDFSRTYKTIKTLYNQARKCLYEFQTPLIDSNNV